MRIPQISKVILSTLMVFAFFTVPVLAGNHVKTGAQCMAGECDCGENCECSADHTGHSCSQHAAKHAKAAAPHTHWDYSAHHGAHKWGVIDDAYIMCTEGKKQSPINIARYMQGDLPEIEFHYGEVPLKVMNTGHGAKVSVPAGHKIKVGGHTMELLQLHFHTPSEHYLDGIPYPMEVHLVHKDANGTLGVVGVMFKVGNANKTIQSIWEAIPPSGEERHVEGAHIALLNLLPAEPGYFAYEGSLTTPPCSEGVKWHVMQRPIEISAEQLRAFQSLFPVNARPIQPLNGRKIAGD